MTRSLLISLATGRTRNDHRHGIGVGTQEVHRKNIARETCTADGPSHDFGIHHAQRTNELLPGGRNDRLRGDPSSRNHAISRPAAMAKGRLQRAASGGCVGTGSEQRSVLLRHRRHALQSGRTPDTKHSQHGQPQATAQKRTALQQQEDYSQTLPQLYLWLADHAVGISHPLADPALHQGVLCQERSRASHSGLLP